jgi:regulation of enolase protein 1 (concanavalin A-like superfamily)
MMHNPFDTFHPPDCGDRFMRTTRRVFLRDSLAAALACNAAGDGLAATSPLPQSDAHLIQRMTWLNPPASAKQSGTQLIVRSQPRTDFWRKTFFGYITDNGHFFSVPVEGGFTFQVRVNGQYAAQYDQAGLMVRLDEQHWMKCGTEFVDGSRNASVVFTHDFSDWSTLPDLSQSAPVWWRHPQEGFDRNALFGRRQQLHGRATGIFRAGRTRGRRHHVRSAGRARI